MKNDSIDFLSIISLLIRKIWLILLCTGLGVLVSGIITTVFVPEKYSANVLLYIWQDKKSTTQSSLTSSDLVLFSQLIDDYKVLLKSRLVTEQVAEQLDFSPEQTAQLGNKIKVENKANTRYIVITAIESNPKLAATLANTVAKVFSKTVVKEMGVSNIQIIDPAVEPSLPSSPKKSLNLAVGGFCGLILSMGMIVLFSVLDTKVRTTKNIEELTGFTLLGTIPEFEKVTIVEKGRSTQ